jgi:large subunit ribosomal protein L18e
MVQTPNNGLRTLIQELKLAAAKEQAPIWKRIAQDLERPTRERRAVNLSRINRFTKENETVIVPGKVLSVGELDHKVTIAAFRFSKVAKDKINKAGAALTIKELLQKHPPAKDLKIIG